MKIKLYILMIFLLSSIIFSATISKKEDYTNVNILVNGSVYRFNVYFNFTEGNYNIIYLGD